MRDKVEGRPYEISKKGRIYTIKLYPMAKTAKNPDKALFSLKTSKREFDSLASKIK